MTMITNEKTHMLLYGIRVTSPIFLSQDEYDNFPENGICGEARKHYYLRYDAIIPVEYLSEVDGIKDVFKETSEDGEVTFYHLDTSHHHPKVLKGTYVDGSILWGESNIRYQELKDAYESFRFRGICFHNDYFAKIDYENYMRERQILMRANLLDQYIDKLNAIYDIHTKPTTPQTKVIPYPMSKVVRFMLKYK